VLNVKGNSSSLIALELARIISLKGKLKCYGPYISSSRTTRKGYKQTSNRSAGDARTSRIIGQGVAESYEELRDVIYVIYAIYRICDRVDRADRAIEHTIL
jgi:hypothetical protein